MEPVGLSSGYAGYNYYPPSGGSPGGGGDRSTYYNDYQSGAARQDSPLPSRHEQSGRKVVIRHDVYQPEDRLKTYVADYYEKNSGVFVHARLILSVILEDASLFHVRTLGIYFCKSKNFSNINLRSFSEVALEREEFSCTPEMNAMVGLGLQ
uniref:Uncharacterized protein n=1 Tax=Rhodnius prolixus TaxID=13249 RepID=T1HEC5_RHOPR